MSYLILIVGLLIWSGAHLFKRVAPDLRARMGDGAKGLVALALVASVVLMVIGYRGTEHLAVWYPPPFLTHVNNLLMVFAVYVFGVGAAKGKLSGVIRHPQLTAVKTWAVAHLLVNGSLAAIVLFGGLLAWAVLEVIVINRAEAMWKRPTDTSWTGDAKAAAIGLVILVVATTIHYWLGVNPFGA